MEGIIGHTQLVGMFDRLLQNGQLSHAYCLVGPAHVGKNTLAREVAARYVGVSVSQLGLHPDVYQLAPEDKENGKIKIEAVRACKEFLSQTSVHGRGLVVIIDDAHTFTDEAASALLKSIEEPPEKTLFLLITPFETLLLDTIRSRCQTLQCGVMAKKDVVTALIAQGVSADKADTYAVLADGRIGIALMCAASDDVVVRMNEYQQQVDTLQSAPLYEKIQLVHTAVEDEGISLSERLSQWCVVDMVRLRTELLQTGAYNTQCAKRLCQYPELFGTLRSNANKQLTLEQFLF